MVTDSYEIFIYSIIVSVITALLVYLIVRTYYSNKMNQSLTKDYVPKELYEVELGKIEKLFLEVDELKNKNNNLRLELQKKSIELEVAIEKNEAQQREAIAYQERLKSDFENLSTKILDAKSEKFTKINIENISRILNPLKEQIKTFEGSIKEKHNTETRDRIILQKEIENLKNLNFQLSQDAQNLTNALRGDSKIQGDWGELQLKLILEKAGLVKDIHYKDQVSVKDTDGKNKRPDFIINLPDNKHVIIDSKVSLTAFEKYINTEDTKEKEIHLRKHLISIKNHIQELSNKKYEHLYDINSPDYILLFIPLESAFALATTEKNIFSHALNKNIVLVTNSTLLATLRTISFIWKQENQKQNVLEIAKQSGLLYDKFVGFIEDLHKIGSSISNAQDSYNRAFNKLANSSKKGDTLIGRAHKLKELGANAKKQLPDKYLEN